MELPNKIDCERFVLGVILRDGDVSNIPDLSANDFFEPKHQDVFAAVLELKNKNVSIDELSATHTLKRIRPDLDIKSCALMINEIINDVQSYTKFSQTWVHEIRRSSNLRKIIKHAEDLKNLAAEDYDPEHIIAYSDAQLKTKLSNYKKTKGLTEMQQEDLETFDRSNDKNAVIGKFRWLTKGSSLLLVSQSGVGKSSFALQFMISLSINSPKGFFGIKAQRPLKIVMLQAENDLGDVAEAFQDITGGMVLDFEQKELLKSNLKIFRDTNSVGKEFLSTIKELIIAHNADVILVDPLLSFAGIELTDQQEMTNFLRHGIARVLEETGAILIAVHHTTKPKSSKDKEGQTPADLAYSGAGASELVNYVREVAVLQRCQGEDPIFKFSLTKRRNRAGLKDLNGDFKPEIYVQHARENNKISWTYSDAPIQMEESNSKGSTKQKGTKYDV